MSGKSMSETERKSRGSAAIRVCPDFYRLVKDVRKKVNVANSDAVATQIIYNGMVFDSDIAKLFYNKKKV